MGLSPLPPTSSEKQLASEAVVSAADVESGEPGDDEKVIGCSSEGDRERMPAGVLGRPSGDRQQAAKQEEEGEAGKTGR